MAGLNSSFMQNPSVMALFLPVAARLSSRTGLPLSRFLLPMAVAIVMGGSLTMVGTSPLILLNDLLVSANANLPSGAATLEPLHMFAPMPIGLALLGAGLLYFRYFGDKRLRAGRHRPRRHAGAHAELLRAGLRHRRRRVRTAPSSADSPLVGMSLGEAEALRGAPLLLALKTGNESRLAPPADARIWVGSVLGAMGERQVIADFAQNHFLRMSTRLRTFGDLFNPSRAGIAEAVVPPTSQYIGKSQAELQLRKQFGISLLAVNRDKTVHRENVRQLSLRAGDMLVLHGIWQDLAQAAENKDFVVVTDYPKGEQRPHKFKLAIGIFVVTMLLALSTRIPVSIALMTGVAGMLVAGVLHIDEAYSAISWKTVFVMACLIPLGWAMDSSGAAAWIAGHTIEQTARGLAGVVVVEIALCLLTTLFSLVIGHVGATIVMVPMAINLALAAGGNPTAFALLVALSASNNFMTASNPVMSMITGPAGYQPRDLWRLGAPLSLVYLIVIVAAVNIMF